MKTATCRKGFILFLLLVCASCHSVSWKNNPLVIVSDRECEAPCWQGITPGVTTFDEAKILAQNITINISENEVLLPDDVRVVDASSHFLTINFEKQSVAVRVEVDEQNIVDRISFYFDRKHRPELGEIIQILGEPESIGLCHDLFEIRRAIVHVSYPLVDMQFIRKLPINGDTFTVSYSLKTRIDYLLYRASSETLIQDFTFPWAEKGVLEFSPEKCNPESDCCKP